MQQLKYYIFAIELLSVQMFSGLNGLLGREFSGSEGDSSYIIFCSFFAFLSIFIVLAEFIFRNVKLSPLEIILLSSPAIVILIYYLENTASKQAFRMFQQYMVWSIPGIYVGLYLEKKNTIRKMLMPLICCVSVILLGLSRSWLVGFGSNMFVKESISGESYQAASYMAAFCFETLLFVCLFKKNLPYRIRRYHLLSIPLMFICLIIIFLTGGRGGMVLVILSGVVLLYYFMRLNKISMRKKVILAVSLLLAIVFIVSFIQSDPILSETSQRVFSYISDGGIDMSKTSHRDETYAKAIHNISQAPLSGYGLFGYFDVNDNYPHNIFLEFTLQGGIFVLIFFILATVIYFFKVAKLIRYDHNQLIFLLFLLVPFVELEFSSSYLSSGLFWFSLAYASCIKIENLKQKN